jgi:hypothetical protein
MVAVAFEPWLAKVRSKVRFLRKLKRGCQFCSTGDCVTSFGTAIAEEDLRKWHGEWLNMSRDQQDVHLLWMFHSDPHCTTAREVPGVSSKSAARVSTSPESNRISTSNSASASDVDSPTATGDRIVTSSDSDRDDEDDDTDDNDVEEPPHKKPRCQYNAGKTRRGAFSIRFLGHDVCKMAARHLMRVGDERVERVRNGIVDGRQDRPHTPGKMTTSVWRFLWTLYHTVGEGMPDKFSFEMKDANTLVMGASKTLKRKSPLPCPIRPEDIDAEVVSTISLEQDEDEQVRSIASHAVYIVSQQNPVDSALVGPLIFRGPQRFLPPGKRVHLYWEYVAWVGTFNARAASFSTFLRAFGQCRHVLRIRKTGNHAVCSTCVDYKKQLSKARFPKDRQIILERYTAHIIDQWLDRQVYGNAVSISMACRRMLDSGQRMVELSMSTSQICMAVDGMDQAKFRLPRMFITTKCLDSLIRPALHVQGAWAHGFGYHLAVMDADMRHDSNNNVEVVSHMLEQIFKGHKGLPMGLHLQQDNTSRECKNQKVLKWAIKLVSLGVFRWVTLNYLTTGHTHDMLDGTFGQITVRLSKFEFDDDMDVVAILIRLLGDLGIEESSRRASLAYKLDEAPCWNTWWEEISLHFSKLTGPMAPHSFRVITRLDLGKCTGGHGELEVRPEPLPNGPPESGGDIVVVVKHYMHSRVLCQVFTAWPESACARLTRQPAGTHQRRPVREGDRRKVVNKAEELHRIRQINGKAKDYLVEWATGERRRFPRPVRYDFLDHTNAGSEFRVGARPAPPVGQVLHVQVQGVAGLLPNAEDSGDDGEDGELVCQ